MNKSIRFGIMGAGSIAHKFASAIPRAEGAELVACASRTPGKAEAFAKEFGIAAAYDNYDALLADPNVDCVYIATTPNFHEECIELCLAAGKHILCEKPLLSTSRRVCRLIEKLEASDRFLMEAMWSRFLPAIRKTREIVRSGELGKLLHLESHFCYNNPPTMERLYSRRLEGSVTTDMGIYNYDITTFLVGAAPDQIVTTKGVLHGETDIEGNVLLHFPGDITAYLCCSYRFRADNTCVLYFENGTVTLPDCFMVPQQVIVKTVAGEETVYDFPTENGFEYEIMEAVRCIREGKQQSDEHPWAAMLESAEYYDEVFSVWGNPWPERD